MHLLFCPRGLCLSRNPNFYIVDPDFSQVDLQGVFIGPRSDHSLPMSLTNWLTNELVEDGMNWPECADYTDYADYVDYAEYAEYEDYAEYA